MDKNKIIEGAAKLVAKGAYDKAIKEYQKVLEADPKDVRVLQKMGELYQKKNDNVQAAHYFTKVAEGYSSDGFFLKSVALYKQVLKLNPNLLEVNLKLAELHQQLGLMSEAMAYFQLVVNHYDKAGDTRSSLDTLKRMVDLDPDNVASKVKLAELYAREGMSPAAVQEFRRAADYLKRNSRTDDYLRVAERLSSLEPDNVPLAKELAGSYLSRGDQKRALAKLQVCFKADSSDVETLSLLAQAFQALGQTSKTISVYKELARIIEERGKPQEVEGIWNKIQALDPADADLAARRAPAAPARPEPSAPAPAAAPRAAPPSAAPRAAAPAAPPPPAAPASPAAVGRDQLAKLLTETDVYLKYGLHDKALDHLRKIFSVDPENINAHEKAYAIYVASGNAAQAFEQLLNVLRLCTRAADVARAQPYLAQVLAQNPDHPEVPAFLSVLQTSDTPLVERQGAPVESLGEDAILVDSNDEELIVSEAPEDALAQPGGDELALATVSGEDQDEVVSDDALYDDSLVAEEMEGAEVVDEEDAVVVEDEPEVFASDGEDEPLVEAREETDAAGYVLEENDEPTTYVGELPSPTEDALPSEAEASTPYHLPDDTSEEFDGSSTVSMQISPEALAALHGDEDPPPLDHAAPTDAGQSAFQAEEPASEECDEASFFLDQGLAEEAREILETVTIAYPGHRRAAELMVRLEELEAQGASAAEVAEERAAPLSVRPVEPVVEGEGEQDAFDLAAELAGELGEPSDEAPSASSDDFQYSVDEVFAEFKKGLEKVVKPEDVDTHYDLGIAYKEMGLLEDAIGEFTVARQGCLGKKREVECLTMMGLLQGMKGDHAAAVQTFKDALGSEYSTGEVTKALSFELATAYEALGSAGKALFHYQRVASQDAKYRDAGAHAARLSAKTKPEDDSAAGKPSGGAKPAVAAAAAAGAPKSRKVGYV